mgnify:CR=1 FL=1
MKYYAIPILVCSWLLSGCGGAEVEQNPPPPVQEDNTNYTGPAPQTDDIQLFKLTLWDNVALSSRCGACHVQEKLVAVRAERFVVVGDASKLVQTLNLEFPLPVEVLPGAWRQVQAQLNSMGGEAQLRMAVKKAGPVFTDQGNLVLDVKFAGGINEPADLELAINNLPGVLENGLFINLADQVLVGEIIDGMPRVRDLAKG